MSEENKIIEIQEESLEKIVGGADVELTFKSLDRGDVFISKTNKKDGILVMSNVTITNNETLVEYRKITHNSTQWLFFGITVYEEGFGTILKDYNYSFEQSGTTGLF